MAKCHFDRGSMFEEPISPNFSFATIYKVSLYKVSFVERNIVGAPKLSAVTPLDVT
jgi:hypothetical protein